MAPCVAVLGLGEAGGAIARDLVAGGARVRGYDPRVRADASMVGCTSEADAATGADVVLSVNSAENAIDALRHGAPGVSRGAVWADLNTAAPALKRRLAELTPDDAEFVDVALMAPVPGKGVRTPMLAAGPGAARYAELLTPLGASIDVLDGLPGVAATRKLLRSVFFKGMAAAVVEALRAADAAGLQGWMRDHIRAEVASADAAFVDRLEDGSYRHAVRREEEMRAAGELLTELGVPPRVSAASEEWLAQLAGEGETSATA